MNEESGRQAIGRTALVAWLLAAVIYFHLLVIYAGWAPRAAVGVAALAVGSAAGLGIPIWWLSGKLSWPSRWGVAFYAVHLVLAVLFSVAWLTIDLGVAHAVFADAVFRRKLAAMQWEALLGLWVYGLIAGASYAVRARRAYEAERRIAERASARAAHSQLAALRAQLNPHFLFNALHSLGTLARHDVRRFDDALERLGDLLRQALDPATAGRVPLADDLAFVENYIEIERLRLGSRLRVEVEVSSRALDVTVPFLTLQPLVENAILHGIDRVPDGGTLRIGAALKGEMLEIIVADDGAGPAHPAAQHNGIGLGALRERLALTYGQFELTSGSAPDGGYVVRVVVPAS